MTPGSRFATGKRRPDQVVLLTLVELLTHLVFLALVLGLVWYQQDVEGRRKLAALQAETAAKDLELAKTETLRNAMRPWINQCGDDLSNCVIRTRAGHDLPNCLGQGKHILSIQALGSGAFSVQPRQGVPADLAAHPSLRALMAGGTFSRDEFRRLAGAAQQAGRAGQFGARCNFSVDVCRAHGAIDLWEGQYRLVQQSFYATAPRACGRR